MHRDDYTPLPAAMLAVLCVLGAWTVRNTPESLAKDAEDARQKQVQRVEEATPRRISEKDGCTVYTFKPQERWLYFTKCANAEATTHNAWTETEHHGKTSISVEHNMEIK